MAKHIFVAKFSALDFTIIFPFFTEIVDQFDELKIDENALLSVPTSFIFSVLNAVKLCRVQALEEQNVLQKSGYRRRFPQMFVDRIAKNATSRFAFCDVSTPTSIRKDERWGNQVCSFALMFP